MRFWRVPARSPVTKRTPSVYTSSVRERMEVTGDSLSSNERVAWQVRDLKMRFWRVPARSPAT